MYATPWEDPRTLNFVLLSGLIGLAAFCGSYAWNVWRRRNAAVDADRRRTARWRIASAVVGGCGLLLALGTLAVREACPPVGQVVAERLFTVRAREDYQVLSLWEAEQVDQGGVIARLYSPPVAAESAQFEARVAEEQAERAKSQAAALDLDDELVRRHQNSISRQQQFRASRDQILPARESVALLKIQGDLERLEKLAHLEDERQAVLGDLKIAAARHTLAKQDLRRVEQVGRQNAATPGQLDEARTRLLTIAEEIRKLEARSKALDKEISQLEASRADLAAECNRQLAAYADELKRIETGLAEAVRDEKGLEQLLANDRRRAEEAKAHDLERLAAKVRQSAAKQTGAVETLKVRAPFAGRVVYRERSPNTAEPQDALLVIGKDDGLVLRLRLPINQVASLRSMGDIDAELAGAALVPYFTARYLRHATLEQRPDLAVVELACRLPAEAARDVVHGRTVKARLHWRPPLWTMIPFNVGASLLVVGLVGWIVAGRLPAKPVSVAERIATASVDSREPVRNASHETGANHPGRELDYGTPRELQYGELAASLQMLGDRLRTSLVHGELDARLISAVEWALDRHQIRAVELLASALGDGEMLAASVEALFDSQFEPAGISEVSRGETADLPRRLSRILAAIAPTLLDRETANR